VSVSTPSSASTRSIFVRHEILARRAGVGELLAREEGKTTPERPARPRGGRSSSFRRRGAAHRGRDHSLYTPGHERGGDARADRRGRLITPWNFPIAIPPGKIAPRSDGNCVLFKAGRSRAGLRLGAGGLLSRSGLPPASSTWSWAAARWAARR